jgi:hypothetical protein
MKRLLICAAAVALFASFAVADSATVEVTAAGAATYSDAINISGYIERVELVKSSDNDVVDIDVATFSGTTILESIVDINALATATDTVVIRPRVVGTGLSGTALAAVTGTAVGTNTTQMLTVPYERIMAGGNVKLKVTAAAGTNATVKATIYYERTAK